MKTALMRPPKHWQIESDQQELFECGLDAATRYRDQAVLVIASSQATSGNYLQCKQSIDGNDWYGKRMRFSCQIKTEGVEAHATLAVSIKSPSGQMVVYDPMIDRSLRGDNDWTEVSVVVDVPDDGRWIVYGPCLWGAGKMWVADFKVQQVSRDTPRTDDHGSTLMLEPRPVNLRFADVPAEQADPVALDLLPGWRWPRGNACVALQVLKGQFRGENVAVLSSEPSQSPLEANDLVGDDDTAFLCQTFSAKPYRGRRLRFASYIKAEDVHGEVAMVLMVNGVNYARLALSRMSLDLVDGSSDWAEYAQVLDVSDFAYSVSIWLQMTGRGKAHFAQVEVAPVSSDVPTTDGNHHPRNLSFSE